MADTKKDIISNYERDRRVLQRELSDLHQRIGELEGALTGLLDRSAFDPYNGGRIIRLNPDQYERVWSLVDRKEARDGE